MSTSLNGGSKQNNASSSTTEQTSTNTTAGSNSTHLKTEEDKMAEKKTEAIDYSIIGAAVAKTLVSANQLSPAEVKIIQGKIYNLFSGVQPEVVDFTIAAYFCVNDPSPDTDWALSPPVVAGGKSVPIVSILNPTVISVAKGDGKLRKFLSTAYEALVPQVIEHTPGVAEQLSARLAKHGFTHVAPIVAVSWVKGVKVETAQSSGARGLFRDRATVRGDKSAVITDSVSVPTPKTDNKRLDAGQKQTFY